MAALVRARWEVADGADRIAGHVPGGAVLWSGGTGWVLVDEDPARRVGGALAWARQQGLVDLHLIAPAPEVGAMARRAAFFEPAPAAWVIDGRGLMPAEPDPSPTLIAPHPVAELEAARLAEAGLDVVVEGGQIHGEVLGLEVARVVVDGALARIEVGVGRFDREAFALLHGGLPDRDALAKVIDTVRRYRRPGAPPHPLNQLGAERWLRSTLVAEPRLVGAASLAPAESALARRNLKDSAPATAKGRDGEGRPLVVSCSTGVDLEVVPAAADDRALHQGDARLVIAVPERDVLPVMESLAGRLEAPASVVGIPGEWRRGWNRE